MIWIVVVSFILAFILSFGLGANDVSNAFATSIGAKVITLKTACLIASIAEVSGSIALGGLVTENIIHATMKQNLLSEHQIMVGMMCSLFATGLWLILATWLKLPVSATHAVVSSIIGFTLVANRDAVNWERMSWFALAWVIAPLLAGFVSVLVYIALVLFILRQRNTFQAGLKAIPFVYSITLSVNVILILYQVLDRSCINPYGVSECVLPICISALAAFLLAGCSFILAKCWIVPMAAREASRKVQLSFVKPDLSLSNNSLSDHTRETLPLSPSSPLALQKEDDPQSMHFKTEQLFTFLQILSAIFTSFAHGSNDVSNSVGPLYGLYNAYQRSLGNSPITSSSLTLYGLLAYGSIGMVIGLYVWGARVIETIGKNLTQMMSPSLGFAIELGSALTVLLASIIGLSVSTTHCKVGSIVAVGFFYLPILQWFEKRKPLDVVNAATTPLHSIVASSMSNKDPESGFSSLSKPPPKRDVDDSHHTSFASDSQDEQHPDLKPLHIQLGCSSPPAAKASVNWKLVLSIVLSWACTIPFVGLISAGLFAFLTLILPPL